MTVIDEQKYFAQKEEIIEFIIQNKEKFGERLFMFLDFMNGDYGLILQKNCPVEMRQIFSKYNLYLDGADEYKVMADLLKQYQFLEGNCAEIGAGAYPRLSELVIPFIKGTLTLYDPNIHFTDFNAKIVKNKFTKGTDISHIDTLYTLYPCEATIPTLEKAFLEDKNLLLAFCDCDHSTEQNKKRGKNYWAHYVCEDYLEKYGNEIELLHWPAAVQNLDLPILIRKSNKQLKKQIHLSIN